MSASTWINSECIPSSGLLLYHPCETPRWRYVMSYGWPWPKLVGEAEEHAAFLTEVATHLGLAVTLSEQDRENTWETLFDERRILVRPVREKERRPGYDPKRQDAWHLLTTIWHELAHEVLHEERAGKDENILEMEARLLSAFFAELVGCPLSHKATDWHFDLQASTKATLLDSRRRILRGARTAAKVSHRVERRRSAS